MSVMGSAPAARKPFVISLHGIRTLGEWQETFSDVCANTVHAEAFKYGRYGLRKFLLPGNNDLMVTKFYQWMHELRARHSSLDFESYLDRPSVVAHSFGTWIVGNALMKHPDLRFKTLILSGSILPRDFDWPRLFARNQVSFVRNEYGERDPWPGVAKFLVPNTGTAGREGFDWYSSAVENVPCEWFGHDDSLLEPHIATNWMPALNRSISPLFLLHGRQIDTEDQFVRYLNHTAATVDAEYPDPDEAVLPRGVSRNWIKINPDIYTFLIDDSSKLPAGYINAMPVTDSAYTDIRNGRVIDREIRAEDVSPFARSSTLKMYVMSINIAAKYRRFGQGIYQYGAIQLLTGFLDKLIWYKKTMGARVTHILATQWTGDGLVLCKQFGMTKVGADRFGHGIYELDIEQALKKPPPDAPMLRRFLAAFRARGVRP